MLSLLELASWGTRAVLVLLLLLLARVAIWLFNLLVIAPGFDPLKNLLGPDTKFFNSHISLINEYVSLHVF
jgi:hypothetical protein